MKRELMKTGIPGFDEILGGGFPVPTACLLIGGPGTGKSIFALQFLVEGARKFNERGLYITLEDSADALRYTASNLGINIEELEKSGMIKIVEDPQVQNSAHLAEFIQKHAADCKARRVVLDSITLFQALQRIDVKAMREELLRLISKLYEMNVVLIATSQRGYSHIDNIEYITEDYLFHGVLTLMKIRSNATFERCINIVKVRSVNHSLKVHPFKIGEGGVTIYPDTSPFSLSGSNDDKRSLG
ncbi:MAG: AAA family ATPase [Candidatus Altiarchaeota archaeon]|nr:AAA family ATPase [Candidatus Altiarchaeota archaeon]